MLGDASTEHWLASSLAAPLQKVGGACRQVWEMGFQFAVYNAGPRLRKGQGLAYRHTAGRGRARALSLRHGLELAEEPPNYGILVNWPTLKGNNGESVSRQKEVPGLALGWGPGTGDRWFLSLPLHLGPQGGEECFGHLNPNSHTARPRG